MRRFARFWFVLSLFSLLILTACGSGTADPYHETFDEAGTWSTGDDTYTAGEIVDGVYNLLIKGDDVSRWAAAGEDFSDGLYEVEVTQTEGPIDNGYGMLLRADADKGDFYLFKISGDGFVWIGTYQDGAEVTPLIRDHWFQSTAVNTGLNTTNKLSVRAESGNLIFYVNDQEVGRVTDKTYANGDIGLFGQTLGAGGVSLDFDNFKVTPLGS